MASQARNPRGALPRFEEAEGLGPQDATFVQDLIAVLEKHGNLERFGLCLLHDHFPLAADEILVETNDTEARTLHTRVEKANQTTHSKPTQWRFLPSVHHSRRAEFASDPYEVVLLCDPYSGCPPRK
ncbi:hypothetical protein KV557_02765 [Kitasatospora aureofaciens]|uniref:hypothetical protein n=1 Tax=Kitasatospora aureofaciens TaxID=1894 RepID=UPI001C4910F5|nr:hypothetical protein [Kitasatospora aureofaciens]MBV6696047.1 hypothetical protein [Kitasatospora aureofaciens]